MTYALNGKENCRKRGLLPCRNGLCLLLTILNKIKPYLHVYEKRSYLMSPAKEVLEEDALLVPASPGATVPASLSGEGGRRPGRSRSSRKQSAGTPPPPCSESPGDNTQYDGFCNSRPSSLLPILKDFSDREGSAKSTVNCYNRRPCPWLVYFLRWPSRPSWWRQQQLQYNSIPAVAIVAASNIWNMNW